MTEHMSPIPSRIYNAAVGGHVCGPEDVDFGQKVVHLVKYDKSGNEVSFESQVTQANKIYVIHDDFTLSSNVTIPANCVLEFDGGSINGVYTLNCNDTQLTGNYINSIVCKFNGTITNEIVIIGNTQYGASIMSCMKEGSIAYLETDLIIDDYLNLKCSIDGCCKHKITMNPNIGNINTLVFTNLNSIFIKNIVVVNDSDNFITTDTAGYFSFCARFTNCKNVILQNCSFEKGSVIIDNSTVYGETLRIEDCYFDIDHTLVATSTTRQHDGIMIVGTKHIIINNCSIKCTNTNRVFKIYSYVSGNTIKNCKEIEITNNYIEATNTSSVRGKQVFDLYNYTKDFRFYNNKVLISGYSRVIENKTGNLTNNPAGDTIEPNYTIIENNYIEYDCGFVWVNSQTADHFTSGHLLINNNILIQTEDAYDIIAQMCRIEYQESANITNNIFKRNKDFTSNQQVASFDCVNKVYFSNNIIPLAYLYYCILYGTCKKIQINNNSVTTDGYSKMNGNIFISAHSLLDAIETTIVNNIVNTGMFFNVNDNFVTYYLNYNNNICDVNGMGTFPTYTVNQ